MPDDIEVGLKLVPDESAIQDLENQELGVAGGEDGELTDLNESQDGRLQVANRKLGRVVKRVGKVGVIAAILAGIAKTLGSVFDIGFEDVRNAVVQAIDALIDAVKSFIPGVGSMTKAPTGSEAISAVNATPGSFLNPGRLLSNLLIQRGQNLMDGGGSNNAGNQNNNFSIFTSRDALVGDSTQQEMQKNQLDYFNFEGGS